MTDKLWAMPAEAVVGLLRRGELTPREVASALQTRIEAVNVRVNALPTLCFERAARHALELEARPLADRGHFAGLPIPIKDSYEVSGVRTTWGSLAYADHVSMRSDYLVKAFEVEGGIV